MSIEQSFSERLSEIDAYLDLLRVLEREAQGGPPQIGQSTITAQQQKILYSSVYLQLYNLVEATATWCIDAVAVAAAEGSRWKPGDLIAAMRREWIRTTARTHVDLNYDNRLSESVAFCERILSALPITKWAVEKGGGGNWDDFEIELISERLGFKLLISPPVKTAAKQHIREDKGSLGLVKHFRNRLAHGAMSFEECGDGVTVADLKDIKDRTANYLWEVVRSFKRDIYNYEFIAPERRPYIGEFI